MARTEITPTETSPAGVLEMLAVPSDTVNGNEVLNRPSLVLTLDNTAGAADATATFVTVATVNGYDVEDVAVTIPMGESRVLGHFPANVFGSALAFDTSAAVDVLAYV